MNLCKPFYSKHIWKRYDNLVEQLFTGGYMAWQECEKCKKVKFDWADQTTPQKEGWAAHNTRVDKIMGRTPKEYK